LMENLTAQKDNYRMENQQKSIPVPRLPFQWKLAARLPDSAARQLNGYPSYMRQILYNRGIEEASQASLFLTGRTGQSTDPFALKEMSRAVARLQRAVELGETVAVYGDYDVDGITATVLLVEALRIAGANVIPYIPNRFDEGYGLNNEALEKLTKENGVGLVVTVDCGVRSPAEAAYAQSLGMDLIISDHHMPASELPSAAAIINSRQPGDEYPDKDLAGVGLAYKIAQALFTAHPADGCDPSQWLELVALGTVADMAPLTGENRQLVAAGLEKIRTNPRQGIGSLAGVAGITYSTITSFDLGYYLGPRLNAAGRLESAMMAYDLLMSRTKEEAGDLAQQLNVMNAERQTQTRQIQERAIQMTLEKGDLSWLIFAADPAFNEGLVGLAASRLCDTFYRPAVVAHLGAEFTRASCRSIPEFHITEALDCCRDLLVRHGGHRAAAGLTVRTEHLPELVERLQDMAQQKLSTLDLRPTLTADMELPLRERRPKELLDMLEYLGKLQPTGIGNPEARFISRHLKVRDARTVGKDASHLRLVFKTDQGDNITGIAFRQGDWHARLPSHVDILYSLEINEYQDLVSPQLNIRDIRPSDFNAAH
jgi:single-stranded-DNA-specific exonuclease